jgi:hypothetical protein
LVDNIEDAFTVNLAIVLTRELRVHRELPEGSLRAGRLELLADAWHHVRERLETAAGRFD